MTRTPAVRRPYRDVTADVIVPAVTAEWTEGVSDAAVYAVLRWAKRAGADVADAGHVCAVLGVDLSGALERARRADRG